MDKPTPVADGMIGKKFWRLTPVGKDRTFGRIHLQCRCDCGRLIYVRPDSLKSGSTKSCGCQRKEAAHSRTHGNSPASGRTGTYGSWANMKNRCEGKAAQEAHPSYEGIKVCRRWSKFANFLKDMGERPKGHSLDRIDPSKGYTPKNCRWSPRNLDSSNTKRTIWVTVNGERMCCAHAARKLGISYSAMKQRLTKGRIIYETP